MKFITLKRVIWAVLGFLALMLFVAFGPPDLIHHTSTPEFCASCHTMQDEHDAWQKSALHRHLKCVDCHLPNDNKANHLVWKGIDGTKDVIKQTFGLYQHPIRISDHGKTMVQENCVRCHGHLTTHVNIELENRNCWDCHRRVSHRVAPLETREIKLFSIK